MLIFQAVKGATQQGRKIKVNETITELYVAKKGLGQAMDDSRLNTSQREIVASVFSTLIDKRMLKPSEALFLTKTLLDKESGVSDFLTSRKKTVLELYDRFGKDEWMRFLDLAKAFKEDRQFGESVKSFDQRHGDRKAPLLSVSRYTATTLHSALKPVYSDGKEVYQAETLPRSDDFHRQFDMARAKFDKLAEPMFKEIQQKETSGVLN